MCSRPPACRLPACSAPSSGKAPGSRGALKDVGNTEAFFAASAAAATAATGGAKPSMATVYGKASKAAKAAKGKGKGKGRRSGDSDEDDDGDNAASAGETPVSDLESDSEVMPAAKNRRTVAVPDAAPVGPPAKSGRRAVRA